MGFIESLGRWAYVILFLLTAGESAAFLGFVVPGETFVIGAGILAEQRSLDLGSVLTAVVPGAIIGDNIGYVIGRKVGKCWDEGWLSRVWSCDRMERVENFYEKHGNTTVFIGRFVGFARPLTPFVAGMTKMRYPTFLLYEAPAAIIWGVGTVFIGYFGGEAGARIVHEVGFWGSIALAAIVVLAVIWFRMRRAARRSESRSQ